ncbi:thiol reductase thioredoxin [Microbacterium sp. AISO3]|uniref:Thiol reductase thioredoxin n=1 Tax=Microbacterium arborescens TaxID=33883 RepID=A0ABX2WF59_9MICO|nr:thiol reductase thioredoxin [Microbacterium paludicola]OAZ39057.1 thiol reductase thioredoxin [Microbacterium arborescens]OWP21061.1 thiol reductase thioredoxin [Microbacterium sp. AISO3]QCR39859.1 thioredoxin [Microbacterium sp. SGAir0570]
MELMAVAVVLACLLAVTGGIGVFVRWRASRPYPIPRFDVVDPRRLGADPDALGRTATLLQFSTETCHRCPAVHRTLAEMARDCDDVVHLDVDVTDRPDIARRFRIAQTPTTLILDGRGVVRTRFGGAPRRDVVQLEILRLRADSASV